MVTMTKKYSLSSVAAILTKLLIVVLSLLVVGTVNGQSPFRYSCNVCGDGTNNIMLYPGNRFIYRYRRIIGTRVLRNCARHYYENIYRGAKNKATCDLYQKNANMISICGCTEPFNGNSTSTTTTTTTVETP